MKQRKELKRRIEKDKRQCREREEKEGLIRPRPHRPPPPVSWWDGSVPIREKKERTDPTNPTEHKTEQTEPEETEETEEKVQLDLLKRLMSDLQTVEAVDSTAAQVRPKLSEAAILRLPGLKGLKADGAADDLTTTTASTSQDGQCDV